MSRLRVLFIKESKLIHLITEDGTKVFFPLPDATIVIGLTGMPKVPRSTGNVNPVE